MDGMNNVEHMKTECVFCSGGEIPSTETKDAVFTASASVDGIQLRAGENRYQFRAGFCPMCGRHLERKTLVAPDHFNAEKYALLAAGGVTVGRSADRQAI